MSKALVLIVEDNADTRSTLDWLLKKQGFDVVIAQDGAAALRIIPRLQPDVIVVDLMVPKINGLDLTRRVRKMAGFAKTPIIVFSAYSDGYLEEAKEVGATEVLRKPEDLLDLSERINQALSGRTNLL